MLLAAVLSERQGVQSPTLRLPRLPPRSQLFRTAAVVKTWLRGGERSNLKVGPYTPVNPPSLLPEAIAILWRQNKGTNHLRREGIAVEEVQLP